MKCKLVTLGYQDCLVICEKLFYIPLFSVIFSKIDYLVLYRKLLRTDTQYNIFTLQSLELNRVEIEESPDVKTPHGAMRPKKKKSYDLNVSDRFWMAQKGSPFPTVAEAVQEELETYRAQEDDVKRLKSAMVGGLSRKQTIRAYFVFRY